mgnify:CR=1 FL=1
MGNAYTGRRPRGFRDRHQKLVIDAYEDLIRYTIRHNQGLNISGITAKIIDGRNEWKSLANDIPEHIKKAIVRGKPERRTVSKRLAEMLRRGEVERVGRGYVSTWMHLAEVSKELNQSVRSLLSSGHLIERNFTHAGNVAACYVSSKPIGSHEMVYDALNTQIERFGDSLFWLDDIVRCAMIKGFVAYRAYSKKRKIVHMDRVVKGLSRCFDGNQLLALTFAISPRRLLKFLESDAGRGLAAEYLRPKWDTIVADAETERRKIARSERGDSS